MGARLPPRTVVPSHVDDVVGTHAHTHTHSQHCVQHSLTRAVVCVCALRTTHNVPATCGAPPPCAGVRAPGRPGVLPLKKRSGVFFCFTLTCPQAPARRRPSRGAPNAEERSTGIKKIGAACFVFLVSPQCARKLQRAATLCGGARSAEHRRIAIKKRRGLFLLFAFAAMCLQAPAHRRLGRGCA